MHTSTESNPRYIHKGPYIFQDSWWSDDKVKHKVEIIHDFNNMIKNMIQQWNNSHF